MPIFDREPISLNLPRPEVRSGSFGDPTTPLTAIAVWGEYDGGPTASGEIITERTALAISTVYTCVTVLSYAVASLPSKLMRRQKNGKSEATDHYLYNLLASAPNSEMTAFSFWSTMVGCAALTGNGYAEIVRLPDGSVSEISPLHPLKTRPIRTKDGKLAFETTDGMQNGKHRIIPNADVLNFPLFSFDGVKGKSPVTAARESFALAKAAEKYGSRWFGNGAHAPSILIKKGEMPSPKMQAELKESWQGAYGGANSNKQAMLFGDWSVSTIGVNPEDSQFLATRGFQRADIAAMFHLQPHQVGDTSRLSNSNHTQAQLSFVTDTMRPILSRIEAEIAIKLLRREPGLFLEFDLAERLRGDLKSQMAAYAVGRQWGFLSVNDVREDLGLNPIGAEGDIYLQPVNMVDAAKITNPGLNDSPEPTPTEPTE